MVKRRRLRRLSVRLPRSSTRCQRCLMRAQAGNCPVCHRDGYVACGTCSVAAGEHAWHAGGLRCTHFDEGAKRPSENSQPS